MVKSLSTWFNMSMYGQKIIDSLYYEYWVEVLSAFQLVLGSRVNPPRPAPPRCGLNHFFDSKTRPA
ncbi:hypothetical protein HID58_026064 [Brassica napus]|uniref:Uncharacterized protein n=1 Tax=Brassica napus TaxID=3708 RepID=A0ABQ8CMW8_BRANA|nr:hypothetical protein HID58_026064 [Brassica napus]